MKTEQIYKGVQVMAMYDFVDTVDESQVSTDLPAEALSINGEWIENLIPEYRSFM